MKFTALNAPRQAHNELATPLIEGKFSIIKILLILLILVQTKEVNAAFTISPQQLMLRVNEGERVGWVELSNTGNEPVAVELVIYERNLDLDGAAISKDMKKSDDFTIYPSQILLYPSNKAKAQIMLKGKERITSDKAYFLRSSEVPFDFPKEEGGKQEIKLDITMTVSFQTIIALQTGKRGSLSFVSSKVLNKDSVEVIVENKSDGRVGTERLYLKAGKEKIKNFTGKGNSIMPGQKRRFTFKHNKALTEREFEYGSE